MSPVCPIPFYQTFFLFTYNAVRFGIKGTVKKIGPIFFREKKLWMGSLLLILYDFVHLEVSSGLPTSVQPLEVEILKFYTG